MSSSRESNPAVALLVMMMRLSYGDRILADDAPRAGFGRGGVRRHWDESVTPLSSLIGQSYLTQDLSGIPCSQKLRSFLQHS